jgi:C-terminal processing protease CtpA/Prc
VRNGPAEHAGIQVRDVVLEIDGKPTRDATVLLAGSPSSRPAAR